MADESSVPLDTVDWRILEELQGDARLPIAELARRVHLGPTATGERVRRLLESGVVTGFHAELDLRRLGLPILAFVRLRYPTGNYAPLHAELERTREILECHHVTGDDCFILKIAAASMAHLEEINARVACLGPIATSIVYSSTLPSRVLDSGPTPPAM